MESLTPLKGNKFCITLQELQALVREPYFSRGEKYSREGVVILKRVGEKSVKAYVKGTTSYIVTLEREGGALSGKCSCPGFADWGPCKHIAATGFTVMHYAQQGTYRTNASCYDDADTLEAIEKKLLSMKKAELIDFIMESLARYPEIEELLDVHSDDA